MTDPDKLLIAVVQCHDLVATDQSVNPNVPLSCSYLRTGIKTHKRVIHGGQRDATRFDTVPRPELKVRDIAI
ncbi:MAG: hypothetical protein VXZ18_05890, partial [Pseudomonadota bacterium]|nr:hypothetical protein [Pseudomonadota bacterium]